MIVSEIPLFITNQQKNDKFQIIPIYKIKKDDTNLRRQMESYFINMLMPDLNH